MSVCCSEHIDERMMWKKIMNVSSERTWQMKVEQMRKMMEDSPYKPTALLLSALDETACK